MSSTPELNRSFNGNLTRLYLGRLITIWFSYETPIAFSVAGEGTFKSENMWTSTMGKHLNSIPAIELKHDEFTRRLDAFIGQLETAVRS